jgi:hypothetical protein
VRISSATASVRGADNPAWCKAGSDHPSAKAFPMDRAMRHLAVLDPKTMKYTFIETCYSTHHPQFGYDANDTLWTSGARAGCRLVEHEDVRCDW